MSEERGIGHEECHEGVRPVCVLYENGELTVEPASENAWIPHSMLVEVISRVSRIVGVRYR